MTNQPLHHPSRSGCAFAGFGHYVPENVITNAQLEQDLGLDDGWIEKRTGITERRWASADQPVSDLAVAAGQMALQEAQQKVNRDAISLLILATSTPDHLLPPTAPKVAQALSLSNAGAFDVAGACAGFIYAVTMADAFVRQTNRAAMVIAANKLSFRINAKEIASAILFADAAGAVVLCPSEQSNQGVLASDFASDASSYDLIKIPAGGSAQPFTQNHTATDTTMALRDGQVVFQKAVDLMVRSGETVLGTANLSIDTLDHWIPHQANARIIEATRKRLNICKTLTRTSVGTFANSSAASIPLTLSLLHQQGQLCAGQTMLMTAAGAGLTGGAIAVRL